MNNYNLLKLKTYLVKLEIFNLLIVVCGKENLTLMMNNHGQMKLNNLFLLIN